VHEVAQTARGATPCKFNKVEEKSLVTAGFRAIEVGKDPI